MAESTDSAPTKAFTLSAQYKSSSSRPFAVTRTLPAPPSASISDRTSYLNALRKATTDLQDEINKELTARMEEDKARDAVAKTGATKQAEVDEDKEEENYGEEVQEED